ncbi:cytoplasmic and nuclear polyadenylate-binding protein [Vairimorpha necatrix]|uniref:Cytoplasmic and nuclear polyadenylate-binding protein n=1 Tax=Vairimorpha necatrix TaxID=6039 RepID=A0AAX4JE67_9MICR
MDVKENIGEQNMSASTVYVGDLSPKTLESDLFRIFSTIGEVSKIRLKKRTEPLSSFAFVTFSNQEDAERAIKEYNNFRLNKKAIRVLPCIDEKSKKEEANLIVKNLPSTFTNENLFDTFSVFGSIISAKIATYADGKPKNYGFVQFDKKKSAKLAIKHCDGGKLDDKVIQVEVFDKEKRKRQEDLASKEEAVKPEPKFTNCFIKNFPEKLEKSELETILSKYGNITSLCFPFKNGTTVSKGFAFANFENHESALAAIEDLHGKQVFEPEEGPNAAKYEPFYIQKAQKKEEREEHLKKSFEQQTLEGQHIKRNLYITNIPNFIEKDDIFEIFSEFGTIISLSIGVDAINEQKKYAYVCYETSDEAFLAIEKGNEFFIDNNKLNVTYFKNKTERSKEKMMSSVSMNSTVPYIYSSPLKMSSNTSFNYDMFSNISSKENINDKLFDLVLRSANTFRHQWEQLGVNTREEFAKKITNILSKKSNEEILEMQTYSRILSEKISSSIEENKKKN